MAVQAGRLGPAEAAHKVDGEQVAIVKDKVRMLPSVGRPDATLAADLIASILGGNDGNGGISKPEPSCENHSISPDKRSVIYLPFDSSARERLDRNRSVSGAASATADGPSK